MTLTLIRSGHELANPARQRELLASLETIPEFEKQISRWVPEGLRAESPQILQLNLGKVCNQTCSHCHVDAGPDRRERMSSRVVDACLNLLDRMQISILDLTGGAPEMHPQFRELVVSARSRGAQVIDRCNLTILLAPGFEWLAEFLAAERVVVIASLPCYLEANVDRQRGDHVFQRSLEALRRLNRLGYAADQSGLELHLVYNPAGLELPPPQARLEEDYRRELRARYGIEFNRLYTITNMPISRFLQELVNAGQLEEYLQRLVAAFNPATLHGLMCRSTLSVDWQGKLYDCDFNQMLELPSVGSPGIDVLNLTESQITQLLRRQIVTRRHCFGCAAGHGSSCQGAVV